MRRYLLLFQLIAASTATQHCLIGSYRNEVSWDICPGYKRCEKGHYCVMGARFPCEGGYYGDQEGLTLKTCSGACPAGYYCPPGTDDPHHHPCGNETMYCPLQSSQPLIIPPGSYGLGRSVTTQDAIAKCPSGYYCQYGRRFPCPGGTYGATQGLSEPTCTSQCPAGHYCPSASSTPIPCSQHQTFCPLGSSHPHSVLLGYYAVQEVKGAGFEAQEVCPPGYYCLQGIKHICPPGRFGSISGSTNSSCSGECAAGYYCPAGSISPIEHACGGVNVYCPPASASPLSVQRGHYTTSSNNDNTSAFDDYKLQTRTSQSICTPGYYCTGDGYRRVCPPGHYGNATGEWRPSCSGLCAPGYFCPEQSTSNQQHQCGGPRYFCPEGSSVPQEVHYGYYTVSGGVSVRFAERRCEPGFYCVAGIKYLCDAGHYGAEYGQNISTCSGICSAGYYCPSGSISPTEIMCGDPSRYCVPGGLRPISVQPGYYSIGGNESTRTGEAIAPIGWFADGGIPYRCPSGRYGIKIGESNPLCSGQCQRGFYCPPGSISPIMLPCGGDDVICPPASAAPVAVHAGYYTTRAWEEGCKPGTWRNFSLSVDHSLPGPSVLKTEKLTPPCELCPMGTYKSTRGDDLSQCLSCPPESRATADRTSCICERPLSGEPLESDEILFFNLTTSVCDIVTTDKILVHGMGWSLNTSVTRFEEFACEVGHYCVEGVQYPCPAGRYGQLERETNPLCEGVCPAGYYCPVGTSYPFVKPCGGVNLYCPAGSDLPTVVPSGYYSDDTESTLTRTNIAICPLGHYCINGEKHVCPAGRYNDEEGSSDPLCKGLCDPGYYCLEGSPSPRQFECGNFSLFCPRGSTKPQSVQIGFYCDLSGDSQQADRFWSTDLKTCSVELPCEPGQYCIGGDRQPCPPGRFGWRYGLTTSECSGKCAPGYYCPSFLQPQPEAPDHTVWPGVPQISAYEYKCGGVGWYCNAGSAYPLKVQGGYYTFGGDSDNSTRRGQLICPPGSYCVDGIRYPCPKGRFGNSEGLSDSTCTGYCPSGFFCPEGTSEPIPCPEYTYSGGGSWTCNTCPGEFSGKLPCQDSRTCCFRGN